jgi:uncharacterized protein
MIEGVMITISVELRGDEIRKIRVSGHGGDAKGRDIICSAVSAVSQTALLGLLHFTKKAVEWDKREGFLYIELKEPVPEDKRPILGAILTTMLLGLGEIQRRSPQKVQILLSGRPGNLPSVPANEGEKPPVPQ